MAGGRGWRGRTIALILQGVMGLGVLGGAYAIGSSELWGGLS